MSLWTCGGHVLHTLMHLAWRAPGPSSHVVTVVHYVHCSAVGHTITLCCVLHHGTVHPCYAQAFAPCITHRVWTRHCCHLSHMELGRG